MRVEVDQMKCNTTGICVKECPQVFRFQEGSKRATVIVDEIPPRTGAKVQGNRRHVSHRRYHNQ